MNTFENGSNFISIVAPNGKAISFACFDDGNHEICFEEASYRNGISASSEEWKSFFEECYKLLEKFNN